MKFAGMLLLLCTVFGAQALAAPTCYSQAELEAEQLLRLHSELMVITVTCRTGSQGEDLVRAYTRFTKFNIKALHEAEQTMIRFYKAQGKGSGVEQLDKLRTKLGNEYGQKIADMSAPLFCAQYRDKVTTYCTLPASRLNDEVQRMCTDEHSYVELCP